jgi:hypothetical protein
MKDENPQTANSERRRGEAQVVADVGFWVLGFGFWVLGFGFWVLGFGF